MRRLAHLAVIFVLPTLAWADPNPAKKQLAAAADALEEAMGKAQRSSPTCRSAVVRQLDAVTDRIDGMRKTARALDVMSVKLEVNGISLAASLAGCPFGVTEHVQQGLEQLEEARLALYDRREERRDDRRDRRDRRHEEDDDSRAPPVEEAQAWAQMAPLAVTTNSVFEREPAVRLAVPELRLSGLQGRTFYLAVKFRSYEGEWSEWVTTQTWTVPQDPFVWKNAFNHFLRYSALADQDYSDGRFIAHISVFDGAGKELAFRESTFRVKLPQLPVTAGPMVAAPPVAPVRDCGTGQDPGCLMTRDNQFPMDGATFMGSLASLRSNPNELLRKDVCLTIFRGNYATAMQLGLVMDLFPNEMFKLDVARAAAPRLVNPQHALGFAAKFRNPMFGHDFTTLMVQQQGGAQAVPFVPGAQLQIQVQPGFIQPPVMVQPGYGQPPPPPGPPPPVSPGYGAPQPSYGQPAYRDCGTGQDPGCTMARAGQFAMDAVTFQGFMTSLRANRNEITRAEVAETMVANGLLTALQLGQVLDLFSNEITRLDVAKNAAPKVVNPTHALGFSAKWSNGILGQEFTQVYASQR